MTRCDTSPFGPDTQRYWDRRFDLFSRFDEVQIDRVGLFSVKPEAIALHIANRLLGNRILDGFCGVGGSAIAFARASADRKVIAVDTDCTRLGMAAHNARVYGVQNQIKFLHGNILDILRDESIEFDAVYLDPEWGGPDYAEQSKFSFSMFNPDGRLLINECLRRNCNWGFTVPKNFDQNELRSLTNVSSVENNYLNQQMLFCTIYFEAANDRQT